jgi:hypothetical protein
MKCLASMFAGALFVSFLAMSSAEGQAVKGTAVGHATMRLEVTVVPVVMPVEPPARAPVQDQGVTFNLESAKLRSVGSPERIVVTSEIKPREERGVEAQSVLETSVFVPR